MATVYTGSASINENGDARGGKAGDQTKREVYVRPWYRHSQGWIVIRAKSPIHRAGIAACMRSACANDLVGYDQAHRDELYNVSKSVAFDPSRVTTAVRTDCSALVRVCLAYCGIHVESFRTLNEVTVLRKTGLFDILTAPIYVDHPDHLLEGDILCTVGSGHTIVVLNDGTPTLRLGSGGGNDEVNEYFVQKVQRILLKLKYDLGVWKDDGDFGALTDKAVRAYQKKKGLLVDGEVGPKTWAALLAE